MQIFSCPYVVKRDRLGVKGEMPPSGFARPTSAEVGRLLALAFKAHYFSESSS